MKRRISVLSAPLLASLLLVGATGCDDDDGDDGNDTAATDGGPSSASASDGNSGDSGDSSGAGEDSGAGDDGGGAVDNVAACEELISSLECGGQDLGMYLPCDSLSSHTCDLVDYFQCLDDEFTCNDGAFDASGWMGCTSLASCS